MLKTIKVKIIESVYKFFVDSLNLPDGIVTLTGAEALFSSAFILFVKVAIVPIIFAAKIFVPTTSRP